MAIGHAVHDPRMPSLRDQVLEAMDPQLLPVWEFCEARNVKKITDLEGAPKQTMQLLKNHRLLPEILKYIKERGDN